jgi:hypothetical protein
MAQRYRNGRRDPAQVVAQELSGRFERHRRQGVTEDASHDFEISARAGRQ